MSTFYCGRALGEHLTDREEAGLRDAVRICSTERDYVYPDHDLVMSIEDTFTAEGHLMQRRHRNPNGSHWSVIFRFDDHGRIVEKEQFGDAPDERQLLSYRYDQTGRLDRILLNSAKNHDRVFESVQYAADGTKTSTCYPIQLDETQRRTTGVLAECALHLSIDTVLS